MKKLLLAALTASLSSTAFAGWMQQPESAYIGLDYSWASIDVGDNVDLGSALVRAGAKILPYMGIEVQASYGVKDDTFTTTVANPAAPPATITYNHRVKNNGSYGIFLKPQVDITPSLTAYGMVGSNYNDFVVETNGAKANGYGSSFSVGGGLTLMLDKNLGVGAEIMHYDSDIDALNVGVRWAF